MNGSYISPVNYNSKQNTPEWGERANPTSGATLSMNTHQQQPAVYFCLLLCLYVNTRTHTQSKCVIVQRRRSARTKTNALMECLLPNYLTRSFWRRKQRNYTRWVLKEKGVGANEWSARSKLLVLDQKSDWIVLVKRDTRSQQQQLRLLCF
jgi:hypothetical protein